MRAGVGSRDRVPMPLRRLALPALVALPALIAAATPAAAGGGLAPGGAERLSVVLPAAWAAQADRLGVSVVHLVQAENECLEPEYAAGDRTCDADGGDLAGQLLVTVAAGTLDGGDCDARGPFVPLDLLNPDAPSRLTVAGAECLSLEVSFPDGDDDNLAQSDSLTFRIRTVAEGPDGVTRTSDTPAPVATPGDVGWVSVGAAGARAGQRGGTTTVGAGQAPVGAAGSSAAAAGAGDTRGNVIGEQTSSVDVGGGSVNVRTEAAASSIGDLVLAWGALFLGVVMVGFLLFRWWIMRRRRPARSAT
jgi:hypothetical protein